MTFSVSLNNDIEFSPQSTTAEILQNVRTILNTRVGTVPLHRDFGISWDFLDAPMPVAKTLLLSAVIDAVEAFEPRAKVQSVDFDESDAQNGIFKPKVIVSIGGEE